VIQQMVLSAANVATFTRYAGNPIIDFGGPTWEHNQLTSPIVFVDPTDPTKLIMIYTGLESLVSLSKIGAATATVSNPYSWTESPANPLVSTADSLWPNSVVIVGTDVYLYVSNFYNNWIDLYLSHNLTANSVMDGSVTFTVTSNIFAASGDETVMYYASVIRDDPTHWYMAHAYRTGTIVPDQVLQGIRIATSSDGISWTNNETDMIHVGAAGRFDDYFIEGAQLMKVAGKYLLFYYAYNGPYPGVDPNSRWTIGVAASDSPTSGWVKGTLNPVFRGSEQADTPDRYHVSTSWLVEVDGVWQMYYQGASNDPATTNYIDASWSLGMATLSEGFSPLDLMR